MIKLKKRFEEMVAMFGKRKPFFEKTIARWGERGKTEWHDKGQAILDRLEKEAAELRELFADAGSAVKKTAVKARVKLFKKMFKQLHESTKPSWRQWLEALLIAGFVALLLRNFLFGLYHVPTGSAEPTILVGDRVWGNKLAYAFDTVKRGELVIFDDPRFKYSKSSWLHRSWQKYVGLGVPLLGLKQGPINLVKRVVAVPGDWIEGRVEAGKTVIYLNDKKLDEPYVNPYPLIWLDKRAGLLPFSKIGPFPIPRFLQERSVPDGVRYTFVPGVPFEEQPYYTMDKAEVIQIPGYPTFSLPYTPSLKAFGQASADEFGPMRIPEGKYWVMGDSRKNSHDSRWFGLLDEKCVHGRLSFIIYSIDSQEPLWLFELLKHPIDFWKNSVRWNRFFKSPGFVVKK
ncbi:signal peptidase I [Candidatus Dependentiae bacterium]|nr:signal peptidase I [Candidatus Dependentiae bacterium]